MPVFRVVFRGAEVICESADDVAALLEKLPPSGGHRGTHDDDRSGSHKDGRWTPSRFKEFVGRLKAPQVKMLQELVKSQHGKTAKDLAYVVGLATPKSFGPIMAAMSRHAKKSGIRIQDVLTSERLDLGDTDKELEFKAAPSFARIAIECGWAKD